MSTSVLSRCAQVRAPGMARTCAFIECARRLGDYGGVIVTGQSLRDRLVELGVDPDDCSVVLDLAAVGATLIAWRNGPMEDWHAVPWCRIDGPQLAQASVQITRAVRKAIGFHASNVPRFRPSSGSADEPWAVFRSIGYVIADPARRLPGGRTVASIAPDDGHRRQFVDHALEAARIWTVLAAEHGSAAVLAMLACTGGWRARHWWGSPWWPARVERFLDRLDDPGRGRDAPSAELVRAAQADLARLDRQWLRYQLLAGLDHLDADVVARCLIAGLSDPALRPGRSAVGGRFRDIAALLEPDTPATARRRARSALEAEGCLLW